MAQNMYKWAKLASKYGADSTLYLNPQDHSALSRPEWEEFDGEFADVFNGEAFLRETPQATGTRVRIIEAPNTGTELLMAYQQPRDLSWWQKQVISAVTMVSPDRAGQLFLNSRVDALRRRASTVRHEPLLNIPGMYPYFAWAELLARHDVIYIASTPFPAYASGRPYCVCSVGGDLQFDCGRPDALGRAYRLAFQHATFLLASNPHTLGHCRRFGFTNAVYLPYPMDTDFYAPAETAVRAQWRARFGGNTFILSTARIDMDVKGQTRGIQDALFRLAVERPDVRFIFIGWGKDVATLADRANEHGIGSQVIVLPPVGKRRLLEYYRAADAVLDQFRYGYLGATALEAASVGKPVVMRIRTEQYEPLYDGDLPPVEAAATDDEIVCALRQIIDIPDYATRRGADLRRWAVRNHGEAHTVPLMLALLRFAADKMRLPRGLDNPLRDRLSSRECEYHAQCRRSLRSESSN